MLALSHMHKRVSSDGSMKRVSGEKKAVKWKVDMVSTRIIEEYDSESERSFSTSTEQSVSASSEQSMTSRDTLSPNQLYSTRFAGLRRLPPTPHPLFNSEALQNAGADGRTVRASIKVDTVADRTGKMPSTTTRFSTPMAMLDLAPTSTPPPASVGYRSSMDTLNDSRRLSSSSSTMSLSPSSRSCSFASSASAPSPSPSSSLTAAAAAAAASSRFAVSGSLPGGSKLEAGLEGIYQLLNKTHACQISALHVQTSDPVLADIVANMQHHLRTEFATFAWPRALTDKAQGTLRNISVLTLVVEITIEYVPEKEGIFRRVTHQLKNVFAFFRRFR